jgi:anthranilate/para-aminobenzoate synthase component II
VNNVESPVPLLGLTLNAPPKGGPFTVTSNEDVLTPQLKLNVTVVRVGNTFANMDRLKA